MKVALVVLLSIGATAWTPAVRGQDEATTDPVVETDFSNPGISPSHWTLILHRDGSGHFHSERGDAQGTEKDEMDVPNVDRAIQVNADFANRVFKAAQQHHWFEEQCESHLKVAFQGWKKVSYKGPEGQGSCTFNYSKDREIQALGDQLMGVAETVLAGARLEMLLQHDPLGLDRETEYLVEASKDGRLGQICAIKPILEKLEGDPAVLDRVRKRARMLLARAGR